MGSATKRQVVLCCSLIQAEEPGGAGQEAVFLDGFCFSRGLQVPTLLEFLPWLPVVMNCKWDVYDK